MNNKEKNKKNKSLRFFRNLCLTTVAAALVLTSALLTGCQNDGGKDNVTTGEDDGGITTAKENGNNVTHTGDDLFITAVPENETVTAGDNVTVIIKVEKASDLNSLGLTAEWDDALTLKDAKYNSELGGLKHTPDDEEGESTGWDGLKCPFIFNWVALDPNDAMDGDFTFVTLQFKAADNASGKYNLKLSANPDNIFDSNFNNIPFTITNAEINVTAK